MAIARRHRRARWHHHPNAVRSFRARRWQEASMDGESDLVRCGVVLSQTTRGLWPMADPMLRREAVTGATRALRCRGWHE
eukprot:1138202-Prymnesium_polylepis.1